MYYLLLIIIIYLYIYKRVYKIYINLRWDKLFKDSGSSQ